MEDITMFLTEDGLIDAHYALQAALATSMINYFSIVSGALIASYLVADRLDRVTMGVVLFVFTASTVGLTMEAYHLGTDLANAAREIQVRAALPGSGLKWMTFASGDLPIAHIPLTGPIMFPALYACVLGFFFRVRWARLADQDMESARRFDV